MANSTSAGLVVPLRQAGAPRLRLYGFAHAGGSASAYRPWASASAPSSTAAPGGTALPPDVELWAIELPGRDRRSGEPFATDLAALAESIAAALAPAVVTGAAGVSTGGPLLARALPFAFFGHCLGAAVAFECARALRRVYGIHPAHLFVAGLPAPHLPRGPAAAHTLADDAFQTWLERRGGIPPELLAAPALLSLLLPRVRADLALFAAYRCQPEAPLDCPLTVLGGTEDPDTDDRSLEAWRDLGGAGGRFQRRMFPGRHFFVGEHRSAIIDLVAEALAGTGAGLSAATSGSRGSP